MTRGNIVFMGDNNVWKFSVISSNDRSNSLNFKPFRGSTKTRVI